MVVLRTCDLIEKALMKKISLSPEKAKTGTMNAGKGFSKIPFLFNNKENLNICFLKTKSLGLRRYVDNGTVRFSLPLILSQEDANAFSLFALRLQKEAKELFKGQSFEKFAPPNDKTLFARVGYDPRSKKIFASFSDKDDVLLSHEDFFSEGIIDVALNVKGVYASGGAVYLEVGLLQARKLRSCVVQSFLPPPRPLTPDSEDAFEEEVAKGIVEAVKEFEKPSKKTKPVKESIKEVFSSDSDDSDDDD